MKKLRIVHTLAICLCLAALADTAWAQTTEASTREEVIEAFRVRAASPEAMAKREALHDARRARREQIEAIPAVARIDQEIAQIKQRLAELMQERREAIAENAATLAAADAAVETAEAALEQAEGREELEAAFRALHEEE